MSAVKPVAHNAVVADVGNGRIVDANERVKAHGALLAGARAGSLVVLLNLSSCVGCKYLKLCVDFCY